MFGLQRESQYKIPAAGFDVAGVPLGAQLTPAPNGAL